MYGQVLKCIEQFCFRIFKRLRHKLSLCVCLFVILKVHKGWMSGFGFNTWNGCWLFYNITSNINLC
jgi:hypothetical protein